MKPFIPVLIFSVYLVVSSCITTRTGQTWPPPFWSVQNNAKKKTRKQVQPPYEFTHALFTYHRTNGHWPASEMAFEMDAANRRIVEQMYQEGFLSWQLGYHSLDTLVVHFIHEPIRTIGVGYIPIPKKNIHLKTLLVSTSQVTKTDLTDE